MAAGMTEFIERRKSAWDRLNSILNRAGVRGKGLSAISRDDLRALGPLYRRAASDLAFVRLRGGDAALIQYLNELVMRAHGMVYVDENPGMGRLLRFLTHGFPRLLRARRVYVLLAAAVFLAGGLFAAVLVAARPENVRVVVPGQFVDNDKYYAEREHNARYNSPDEEKPAFAAGLMTHNIGVAVLAFGAGVLGGFPVLLLLFSNGLPLGGLAMQQHQQGRDLLFWSLILPHGIVEITAILIGGAAGMMIGHALIAPGDLPRHQAVTRAGNDAVRMVLGTVPLFIVAAFTEAFITPSALPSAAKIGYAALTVLALWGYTGLGRDTAPRSAPSDEQSVPA